MRDADVSVDDPRPESPEGHQHQAVGPAHVVVPRHDRDQSEAHDRECPGDRDRPIPDDDGSRDQREEAEDERGLRRCGTDGIADIDVAVIGDRRGDRVRDLRQIGADGEEGHPHHERGDVGVRDQAGRGLHRRLAREDHSRESGDERENEDDDHLRDAGSPDPAAAREQGPDRNRDRAEPCRVRCANGRTTQSQSCGLS